MEQQCADDIEPKETLYNEAKTLVREKSVAHNLLTDKKKELNENLGVARKKYGEYENEKIKMNQQLSTLRKNIQRFEEQIKEINNANETMKSDRDRLIKNEQIERHEAEIEAINREITKAKEDVDELDKAKPSLNDKSYEARNAVDNAKRELDIIRRDIQNAKQGKGNKFSAYHKNMQRLYESVEIMDRERKWTGFTPIGPLGLHISLKDNYYSTVIESELRSILACFIVANHEDRKRLNEAMRRAGW